MDSNFDIADKIGAVTREVIDRDHEGKPARLVVLERTYPAPADDVWDALTNAERIPRWFLPISGDLELGGRYQLEGNAGGEILACKPPHHLAVTWEFGGGVTWLDVHLHEEPDGGTRLRMEHLAHVDPDDPHMQMFGPGAVGIGWDLSLLGLDAHLAEPDLPKVDEGELTATPAGQEFMRRSGEAWLDADIAAGTPEEDARRRGQATIAAYTGGDDPEG
jgi:uncharacterized protein YndB with AHSA1/START domain